MLRPKPAGFFFFLDFSRLVGLASLGGIASGSCVAAGVCTAWRSGGVSSSVFRCLLSSSPAFSSASQFWKRRWRPPCKPRRPLPIVLSFVTGLFGVDGNDGLAGILVLDVVRYKALMVYRIRRNKHLARGPRLISPFRQTYLLLAVSPPSPPACVPGAAVGKRLSSIIPARVVVPFNVKDVEIKLLIPCGSDQNRAGSGLRPLCRFSPFVVELSPI